MKMLVVDDTLLSRQLMTHALKTYGEIEIAVNGEEAIEAFELAWKDKSPFDVIFMDIMMPEMDGREALRRIRDWEDKNKVIDPVKVVMSTALGDKDNVLSSFKEGAEYYLVKPIELNRLYDIMSQLGYSKTK
ncbi:MAG: hypothetical protein A2600_05980 [Candidatus Lambdaproteobacteria bacterium RIFOXYD1_FULL_56_27]|uniref:Response regulatory domain-containing protein n=1 Tax=Candidatus Lambdaproteobacteria bacterium RIFOXYD2_FULL_56_26 TaxID=1817773 RepID=A0A1F6GM56_9PROT|nr:MAG: hypothetical protein A2557_10105 [Candidatus Lambdaproteobacteria bacterium RIFOXYD2_FULL_56_26]OGH01757.1 MAG: hypothetical protein A2426_14015 [Candidatus Lambdaproteobacteria bacterium RIFOXYC1_FULL_56_13]OGH07630.1 MAG: hypothetical protein A2600_05980 [Candidatus Lambdaproteobacteria bacterium RIFOXYD1_FULL_56_27]